MSGGWWLVAGIRIKFAAKSQFRAKAARATASAESKFNFVYEFRGTPKPLLSAKKAKNSNLSKFCRANPRFLPLSSYN